MTDENNDISLREHFDSRVDALEKTIYTAMRAAEKAVEKAEAATEKRFEGVNEFRNSLADNARLMMPRPEAEQAFRSLSDRVDRLTTKVDAHEYIGRGRTDVWGWVVGGFGLVIALLMAMMKLVVV